MRKLFTYYLTILLVGFNLTSCTKILYTSIDVLKPAKVAFDGSVKNVLLINNSPVQPSELGHSESLLDENTKNIYFATDSLSIFCISALDEDLRSKNFFSSVQLIYNSLNKSGDFFSINTISVDTISALCKKYNAEAIISLDRIKVNDDISEFYDNYHEKIAATLDVKMETLWSVHYPQKSNYSQLKFNDTIFWESSSLTRFSVLNGLPKRGDALIDGALYAGKKTVDRLVPYWEKKDRYFYNPSKNEMHRAMDSIYVKNWESAIQIWKSVIQKNNSSWTKAQSFNNIAIAYEIMGDIDEALENATNALQYASKVYFIESSTLLHFSEYVNELSIRKSDFELLKKQLAQ